MRFAPTRIYPIVPLRDGVVFPHTEPTLTFGRPLSISGIESAIRADKYLVLVSQKNKTDLPNLTDLYEVGTLCEVEQFAPMGHELLARVKGIARVRLGPINQTGPFCRPQLL